MIKKLLMLNILNVVLMWNLSFLRNLGIWDTSNLIKIQGIITIMLFTLVLKQDFYKVKLLPVEVAILFLIIQSIVMGIINNNATYEILKDILNFLNFFLLILSPTIKRIYKKNFKLYYKIALYGTIVSFLLNTLIIELSSVKVGAGYFTLSNIYPFSLLILKGKPILNLLYLLMVIIAKKRAVILSFILIYITYVLIKKKKIMKLYYIIVF